MKKTIGLIFLLGILFGSAAFSANMLPNVEIDGVNKKTVLDTLTSDLTGWGFTRTLSDEHQVTFKAGNKNPITTALAGYTDWFLQVSFIILQKEQSVKITVSAQKIGTTKKGAIEAVTDDSIIWPTYLQYLKIKYNGGAGYGLVLAANPPGKIIAVAKGSDADSQGIQAGWSIAQMESHIVSFMSSSSLEKYLVRAEPNTALKVKMRNPENQLKEYVLTNRFIPAELSGR